MLAGIGTQCGQRIAQARIDVCHQKVGHDRKHTTFGVAAQIEILDCTAAGCIDQVAMVYQLAGTPGDPLVVVCIADHVGEEAGMRAAKPVKFTQCSIGVGFEIGWVVHEGGIG